MKLLDIMLKHEIKWPAEAQCAVQDDDGILKWVFSNSLPELWDSGVWYRGKLSGSDPVFGFINLADDWHTRIITHAEYQAAGGWMRWEGGECPVDGKATVDTKWDCDTSFECLAEKTTWMHEPDGANIIAYRITNQRPVQLDNPEIEPDFEPFVSIEDAHECKAERAATSKQSAPKGSGNPILGMVLADLTNRALEGKEKYGEPLKAHNGRNALWDAYQEALDLAMYLRQLIQEQQDA